MPDLSLVPSIVWAIAGGGPGTDVTPIDTATTSIVSYVLGYGLAGIIALAFAFRFIVPASVLKEARENARADLLKENERLQAEIDRLTADLAGLQEFVRSQLVPSVTQFTAVASSLIPLLQSQISSRRGDERERGRE